MGDLYVVVFYFLEEFLENFFLILGVMEVIKNVELGVLDNFVK